MPAATVDLFDEARIEAGSWYDVTIPVNDVNGDPFVMTSGPFTVDAAEAQFRQEKDSPGPPLMKLNLVAKAVADGGADGVVITDGFVRLSIAGDTSANVSYDFSSNDAPLEENRDGYFAVEIYSNGVPLRVIEGQYQMTEEVVREEAAA